MNNKDELAIQYLESFKRKIQFGDILVTEVDHSGHTLLVKGKYSVSAINEQHEELASDLLGEFEDLYASTVGHDSIKDIDVLDETIAGPIAKAMLKTAEFTGIPKGALWKFDQMLNNRIN